MTVTPVDATTVSFAPIIRVGVPVEVINRGLGWSNGLYMYSTKCGSTWLAKKFNGAQASILSGPYTCGSTNIRWWEWYSQDSGYGWVKDGAGTDPWLKIRDQAPSNKFVGGSRISVTNIATSGSRNLMGTVPILTPVATLQLGWHGTIIDGPYYGANKLYPGMHYHWRVAFDNGMTGWVMEEAIGLLEQ